MAIKKAETVDTQTVTDNSNANYDERLKIDKALKQPVINKGRCIGRLVALEYLEATGEVRTTKNGVQYTDSSDQLKFTFEVEAENTPTGKMDLMMWTNTTVDGVRDDNDKFSRLTRLFVALEIVDGKKLKPTTVVPSYDLNEIAGEYFSFKVEMKGRIWKPVIDSFTHIEDVDNYEPVEEESKAGFDVRATA